MCIFRVCEKNWRETYTILIFWDWNVSGDGATGLIGFSENFWNPQPLENLEKLVKNSINFFRPN
jgi:hypothetical protein